MNIVVLSTSFSPLRSPVTNTFYPYLLELIKDGHDIDVICPLTSNNPRHLPTERINIHYITNLWNSLRILCCEKIGNHRNLNFWTCILYLIRIYGVIITPFCYPTRHRWRKQEYILTIKELIEKKNIDVLISLSGLPCAHLAALKIKKEHPEIEWITYTLDPFTYFPPLYNYVPWKNLRKKKNYRKELEIYNTSDYNIFSEELYNMALIEFKQPIYKTFAFNYVLKDLSGHKDKHFITKDYTTLVYAGALSSSIRNPERMLAVISKTSGIRLILHVCGDCNPIIEKYKNQWIEVNGMLPYNEYLDLICNKADILINIGNNNNLQAPSKFVELLSTCKPIINFYQKQDSCYNMIEKYPLGLNVGPNDINAEEKVCDFCYTYKGHCISFSKLKEIFPNYSFENQMKILRGLLEVNIENG